MRNQFDDAVPRLDWSYSHTQVALWQLCQRRYHEHYVLGKREPTTPNMAAGTWLCQNPIEKLAAGDPLEAFDDGYWQSIWANFLAEFGGDGDFKHALFNLKTAKTCLKAYQANPVVGLVDSIEKRFWHDFPTGDSLGTSKFTYQSRPDFVVERTVDYGARETERVAWDIKLKTFNQSRVGDTFFLKPELSPFDDQGVGQAVLSGASFFGQIQFWIGKKDGVVIGPVYLEQKLSPTLADEWKRETLATLVAIDAARNDPAYAWPKTTASCKAFGRECDWVNSCRFGKTNVRNTKGNGEFHE